MKPVLYCTFAWFIALSVPAIAYVGPGPGITMVGSLIGLVGSVVAALLMVLAWPLRMYFNKRKAAKNNSDHPPSSPAAS